MASTQKVRLVVKDADGTTVVNDNYDGADYGGNETSAGPGASLARMRGTLARV